LLKFVFWSLLAVNALLLAYGQGYLGKFKNADHEPARLKAQVNTDKIALITAAQAEAEAKAAKAKAAEAASASPSASAEAPAIACLEFGPVAQADTKKFDTQLDPLGLAAKLTRVNVPVMDVTQHVVYIPPQGSREAAERKASELRDLGVNNFYIMNDNTPLKNGISLGVFKSEAAAQTLLAALNKQGVHSARITGRGPMINKVNYQFRGIGTDVRDQLTKFKPAYAGADIRTCK
jgi:hypothetical protein